MCETTHRPGITDEQINASNDCGDQLFEFLLASAIGHEEMYENLDADAILYGVWVDLTHHLVARGWTMDDLTSDVQYHASCERSN